MCWCRMDGIVSACLSIARQRSLCDAAPRGENVEGGLDFWLTQAEILLSGRALAEIPHEIPGLAPILSEIPPEILLF